MPADIAALYQDYPIHRTRSAAYNRLRAFVFRDIYRDPGALPAQARVLDYGCGDGWYLARLRDRGAQVCGYEFVPAHAAALAGLLNVPVAADFDALRGIAPGGFDLITLHFVFEHVPDPVPLLQRLAELLTPAGKIYVVIPEVNSWEARCFKRAWHGLDPPRHLSLASERGISAAAQAAGLRVEERRKLVFPNTVAGSLATLPTGRFIPALFTLALPLGVLAAALAPGGSTAYLFSRRTAT